VSIRYTLIRYEDPGGEIFVGSGFLVNGHAVLTADHVAEGRKHRIVFAGQEIPVKEVVRSGTDAVDLAVLILKHDVAALQQVRFAQVYRGGGVTITGVWAVGFPRLNRDAKGRASMQVEGYIVPADGVHPMASGGADGEWLTLVGTTASSGSQISDDLHDPQDVSPWAGMSGAVVIKDDMVVGVIRSPSTAKGPQALAVTPLTALRGLPEGTRQRFRAVLGLDDIDALPIIGGGVPVQSAGLTASVTPAEPLAGVPQLAFSADVRDRYRAALMKAGLTVPDTWDIVKLTRLRHAHRATCQVPDATADLLDALCLALQALPVLEQVGGRTISIKKLWHLYRRHVGRWPDAASPEGMLILAASASIAERHHAESDPGDQAEPANALARFLLGVAGHWGASARADTPGHGAGAPGGPGLQCVVDWLTGPLVQQQEEDVADYLRTKVGGQSWALIELAAEESSQRTRPAGITIDLIPERGPVVTQRVPVTGSLGEAGPEEGVLSALREAVSMLPEDGVFIDLCLPRHWLEAGVEHWDVVQVGNRYESMTRHYSPRLRWAMQRHDRKLRTRLEKRFSAVDWSAAPEQIPSWVTGDPVSLQGWLDDRDQGGIRHPPYIAGVSSADEGHDPLGTLLWEGYGLAVWFSTAAQDDVCARAASIGARMKAPERRHDLPEVLAAKLRNHRPAIIWSDPEGRAGFRLPGSRGGGTLRGGST
jgi:hypothetical protein